MTIKITHFMRRPRPNVFSIERLYEDVRSVMPDDCVVTVWTCRNFSNGLRPRLKDMWLARRHQGDVNHVTGDVHFLALLLDSKRTILTVHDLLGLKQLRGIRRTILWFFWYWLPVRRSRFVVAISDSTRQQLLKVARCHPDKVRVIYNPVSDEFQPNPRTFNNVCPRILQIGTKPNKNIERIAEALEGVQCRLVIVGTLSQSQLSKLQQHSVDYENYVGLSREEMVEEYISCDMLVFASTYEGFGLPIIEANAVGRPVVTSNISSMPEVAGEAACFVNPFDVASLRAGIVCIIEDAEYRARLIDAGYANARRFQSTSVAERYSALYREIAVSNSLDNSQTR